MYNKTWDKFFGNPIISSYLEEAEIEQPEDGGEGDDGQPSSPEELGQLTADFQSGHINQDDLINMYKSGKITKEDVQQIVQQVEQGGQEEGSGEEPQNQDQEGPTEEELLAQQIDQTNDLFVKFSIYDKINELSDKLEYFQENFEDIQSELYERVLQLKEFLNILSNLVFNVETSVAYQMYGSILLQLTDLFTAYNSELNSKSNSDKIEDQLKEKYRDGEITADPVDNWADQNKSDLMPNDGVIETTNDH
jgi:hypothetical protein